MVQKKSTISIMRYRSYCILEWLLKCNTPEANCFSTIFVRPKKDGSFRMILNLKQLNESVEYHHFKMDTFHTVLKVVKPSWYMASVNLRQAYYSVPIDKNYQLFSQVWVERKTLSITPHQRGFRSHGSFNWSIQEEWNCQTVWCPRQRGRISLHSKKNAYPFNDFFNHTIKPM